MSPDKARQIGNDLACLAASIAKIAKEIKAMHDFDHDHENEESAPPVPGLRETKREEPKTPSLEEVRSFLAERSRAGHTAAIREILLKHGADRLSEVDPAHYTAVLSEARALG